MTYYLEDIHYERCQYFDKEIIDEENYNAFDDFLLSDLFNKELIIDVLDYLKDDDILRLKKYDITELKELLLHLGIQEGFELSRHKNNILSDEFISMNNEFNISDDIKNIELIQEYNQILLSNKKTNEKLFELFDYNKKILYNEKFIKLFVFDAEEYNLSIEKDNIYNLTFKLNSQNAQIIEKNFNEVIEKDVLPNSLTHLTFGKYCVFNQIIET